MVFGILAIILGILGIAVFGRDDAPSGGTPSALTNKDNLGSIPAKPTAKGGGDDIEHGTKEANAKGSDDKASGFVGHAVDIDDKTSSIEGGSFHESNAPGKTIDPDADVPVVDPQKDTKKPVDPTPAQDDTPKTYKVKKGDTLSKIAVDVYHDKKYVDDIQKANPGLNPSKMFENQVIQLPPKKEAPKSSPPSKSSVKGDAGLESSNEKPKLTEGGKTHIVVAGNQRLINIVDRLYGDTKKVPAIQKLNADLHVKDWNNIPAGTVLKLP